jgi:hypothetical protein
LPANETGQHFVYAQHHRVQLSPLWLVDVSEASGELELSIELTQGCLCDVEKVGELLPGLARGAFGDVARNANRRAPNLIA